MMRKRLVAPDRRPILRPTVATAAMAAMAAVLAACGAREPERQEPLLRPRPVTTSTLLAPEPVAVTTVPLRDIDSFANPTTTTTTTAVPEPLQEQDPPTPPPAAGPGTAVPMTVAPPATSAPATLTTPTTSTTTTTTTPTTTATTPTTTATTTAPTTTPPTTEPSPTTTATAGVDPIVFRGTGDGIVDIGPDNHRFVVQAGHTGMGDTFAVDALDASSALVAPVLRVTGDWSGSIVLVAPADAQRVRYLRVTTSGAWSLALIDESTVPAFGDGGTTGEGSAVLRYDGGPTPVSVSHGGPGAFELAIVEDGGPSVVCAGEGASTEDATLPAGPLLVAMVADGSWSIALS